MFRTAKMARFYTANMAVRPRIPDPGLLQAKAGSTQDQVAGSTSIVETTRLHLVTTAAVQYSTVWYGTVQYSTVQYGAVQYSTIQYSTVQYSTIQYRPSQGQ